MQLKWKWEILLWQLTELKCVKNEKLLKLQKNKIKMKTKNIKYVILFKLTMVKSSPVFWEPFIVFLFHCVPSNCFWMQKLILYKLFLRNDKDKYKDII